MRLIPVIFFLLALSWNAAVQAQRPATSNVYLFQIRIFQDSLFEFTQPQWLTKFNELGYNNHPAFFNNDELYLSVQMANQTMPDLYRLDLSKRTKTQITDTPEGEYSPTRSPDPKIFSAVRMEYAPKDTLIRLWQFPMDRTTNGKPVLKYFNDIGYYTWLNSSTVAAYRVGNPSTLSIIDVNTDRVTDVSTNIGRCLKVLPNGNLVYIQQSNFGRDYVMEYNPYNRTTNRVVEALAGSQDFEVMPDGVLIMGQGSKLFKFDKQKDTYWIEVGDLKFYNIRKITRLAISDDMKLALVSE